MTKASLSYICLALSVSMLLAGCGIKPGNVSAPPGAEGNGFPHTYPDLSRDPPPPTH